MTFHNVQRLRRQFFLCNKLGFLRHQLCNRPFQEIHPFGQAPADIAVCQQADHTIVLIHYGNRTQSLVGNDKQSFRYGSGSSDHRVLAAAVHDVPYRKQQLPAQAAAGMEHRKLFGSKIMFPHERHGQRVTESQGRGSAGGGSQPQGAGFSFHAHVQDHVCIFRQGRIGIAYHGDELRPDPPQGRQYVQHFPRLAAVGHSNDYVICRNHAQIPMDPFCRVQIKGRGAGAGQGRGNLMGDDAGLSHAGHDDTALAGQDHIHCRVKMLVNTGNQIQNGFGFHLQHFLGIRLQFVHGSSYPFHLYLRIILSMASTSFSNASRRSRRTMLGPSLKALEGSSCTSRNSASMPIAAAALAI